MNDGGVVIRGALWGIGFDSGVVQPDPQASVEQVVASEAEQLLFEHLGVSVALVWVGGQAAGEHTPKSCDSPVELFEGSGFFQGLFSVGDATHGAHGCGASENVATEKHGGNH